MNKNAKSSVGVVIVTYQAERHIRQCLTPLMQSSLKPSILVVDSSSTDRTVEIAKEFGVEVQIINKKKFNHGMTREKARRYLKTDIVVFLTQDAYLVGDLQPLIKPILERRASIAYARQIPHEGAGFFEAFAREYLYPPKSEIRKKEDSGKYGIYTCFCSNSCAAYANSALDEIGGFGSVLMGEDTLAAARLLLKGHAIAYAAESVVRHSHRFKLSQEFSRYYDIGVCRKKHRDIFSQFGEDRKKGQNYAWQLIMRVIRKKPWLIPYACAHIISKWLGYRFGASNLIQDDVKI